MSRLAYYADFITMPLLILLLLAVGEDHLRGLLVGFIVWTFAEYVIHRVLFHPIKVVNKENPPPNFIFLNHQ